MQELHQDYIDSEGERKPLWGRHPREGMKAFYAFRLYRDMGYKRSLVKVAKKYAPGHKILTLIERWSRKYDWVRRVKAYDHHLDMLPIRARANKSSTKVG